MSTYNCSDPVSISNGYYVVDKSYYENGDQVYFICNSDYSLSGNPLLTCDGTTGNWSGNYPSCSSTTTTSTTTTPANEEWVYVGVGLISFLGLLFLLIILLLLIKVCYRLCRKWSRVSALHGIDEQVEVGCCFACCNRCCLKCCKCCQDDSNIIKVKTRPKVKKPKQIPKETYISPPPASVISEDRAESTAPAPRIEVKPAKEIAVWKPHSHPVRKINTSTK
ncbi:uncharacterized protein LOC130048450 [Ostrea edulis]|uniref:uncharacterized protein LOC130048450 n=1 Tax=Ostrea edulis TaxID=37623 RepID=UPI0024AFDCD8|nr:uncharacterized protein LOC130048450 [Ostrea edulis]